MEKFRYILDYFEGIQFNEEKHKYKVNDIKINISVSGVVHKFVKKFDRKGNAKRVALKRGIDVEEVYKEWDYKKDFACDLGNRTHLFGEKYTFNRNLKPKSKFEEAIVKFWNDLPQHIVPIFVELQMYHKKHLIAGTADIILYNTQDNTFIIADYKTNKDLFKNFKGQKLLFPFSYLLDTNFNKYQLQLSLYQILLEQVEGVKVSRRIIVWLRPNGEYELYETTNFTKQLKDYLKDKIW